MEPRKIARFANLIGGSLSVVSLVLPWLIEGQNVQFLFLSPIGSWVVLGLVLTGGLCSFVSRYGGWITTLGVLAYLTLGPIPRPSLFPADYSFGPGFWLAWSAGPITLLGLSSNSTKTQILSLPRQIRWIIPPLGTALAVFGGLFVYAALLGPAPTQPTIVTALLPITGLLTGLVGMTRGSILIDHHPQIGA